MRTPFWRTPAPGLDKHEGSLDNQIMAIRNFQVGPSRGLKLADANKDNIRCLFRPISDPTLRFDIDDLSSGEKAAIALFLPFIEKQALALAQGQGEVAGDVVPLTVLIDEPEIHLHPLLQLNVLEYMRALARTNQAQFIFTCHSPTILDALSDDELWLLSPASLVSENQLARLTNSHEHLEVARMLTGSTHMLTRGKPIVFVEGESDIGSAVTDERLLRLMLPNTSHWAIVPAREKRGVIDAAEKLRRSELALPGQPVFGLVDADRDEGTLPDYIIGWPVAMIENLLLDVDAIAEVLAGFEAVTTLGSAQDVRASLDDLVAERRAEEIGLRVQAQLPVGRIALTPDDLTDPSKAITEATESYMARLDKIDVAAVSQRAEADVERILANGEALERFHGKRLLHAFQNKHKVSSAGFSKPAFATKLAMACAGRERAERLATSALDRIRLFFPSELTGLIEAATVSGVEQTARRDELARLCGSERDAWRSGSPSGDHREDLRTQVFSFARELDPASRKAISLEASRIGTA